VWSLLYDFYDFLEVPVNPAAAVEIHAPRSERLYNIPSSKETAEMVAAMHCGYNQFFALRNLLLGELAYGSGLRLCELHRCDIGDIDVQVGTITVTGKGSKVRTVPVTTVALRILGEYLTERKASHGPLFVTEKGRRLGSLAISVLFRKYTGRSPHLFRHACASHMLQNGCDIRYIQELLGHRFLTTTQVYTHFDKQRLKCIINSKHPRSGADKALENRHSSLKDNDLEWKNH
jgi:integrase/recombinase XerC